jgi:hypothetical protein
MEKFEEELKAANVQVVNKADDVLMADADTKANNDTDVSGWGGGSATGTWGEDYDSSSFNFHPWTEPAANWDPPEFNSLMALLGPTALPLTHTPGVVEWAVRRIKSFTHPPPTNALPMSPVVNEVDPEAVELELQGRFAKVVFSPWIGWDQTQDEMPHLAKPRILETSRGPVIGEGEKAEAITNGTSSGAAASPQQPESLKPHDPFNDDITVLVEPGVVEYLSVGMGIGATWVQLAREQDFAEDSTKMGKKKKGKSKKNTNRYWYIDELLMVLPSYHS